MSFNTKLIIRVFFKEFNNDKNNIIVELDIESLLKLSINNFKLLKTKSLDNLSPEYVGNFEIKWHELVYKKKEEYWIKSQKGFAW